MKAEAGVVYEVHEHLDKEEGRGGTRIVGYFRGITDAKEAAKGLGPQGSPGDIRVIDVVVFEDGAIYPVEPRLDPALVRPHGYFALRAAALAKLTPAERAALGLPEE